MASEFMRRRRWRAPLLALIPMLHFVCVASSPTFSTRGMTPEERSSLAGKTTFTCKDGGQELPISKVNDDFCDCTDGSDEPGTSACPDGEFYCVNKGHVPLTLRSSRVNDGICDCCDGSDEYSGWVQCERRCAQAGEAARKELAAKVAQYTQGSKVREEAIAGFTRQKEEWHTRLATLEQETGQLEESEKSLREAKEAIEKAEREEREWREKLEREQQERERLEKEGREKAQAQAQAQEVAQEAEQAQEQAEEQVVQEVPPAEGAGEAETETEGELAPEGQQLAGEPGTGAPEGAEGSVVTEAEKHEWDLIDEEEAMVRELEAAGYTGPAEPAQLLPETLAPEVDGDGEDLSHLSKEEMGRRVAERWTGGEGGVHVDDPTVEAPSPAGGEDEGLARDKDEDEEDMSQLSKEEMGRRVAERWTGHSETESVYKDDEEYHPPEDDDLDDDYHDHDHDQDHDHDHEGDEDEPPLPEEDPANPVDVGDDVAVSPRSTWWARMLQWPRQFCSRLYSLVAPLTPPPDVNHTEASRVKREYAELQRKLNKARSEMDKIRKKLDSDYGPQGEFVDFADKCFKINIQHYVYEVCPFKEVTQKEGHSHTTVGRWRGFEDNYSRMVFENGDHCWNGPSRSMKVTLQCGMTSEILSVEEPSRCEYAAVMTTPAVCRADVAKEFQEELDRRERELASIHDEL